MASEYGFPDHEDESNVIKYRLLPIEEKPFKRVTKRLATPDSILVKSSAYLPTPLPTPVTDPMSYGELPAATVAPSDRQNIALDQAQWREDVLLDFASLEGSLVRIQVLRNCNAQERERYESEKLEILSKAQAIREDTIALRAQLVDAQHTLELRHQYDLLAERITSNRLLRPREEQIVALAKLEAEIEELEAENRDYADTWAERCTQFRKIVDQGRQMLKMIRDEKEEAERKVWTGEGVEEDGDTNSTVKGSVSISGTPRIEADGSTPLHHGSFHDTKLELLKDRPGPVGASPREGSAAPSLRHRDDVTIRDEKDSGTGVVEDIEIQGIDEGEVEEGEEMDDGALPERMDTS